MNKQLAKITSATLEIKERGILNFWIMVDYEEGCSQGIGGYILDEWNEEKQTRVGTAFGCEVIRQLLFLLDVNDFSEMKGKMVWVLGEGTGMCFTPKGLSSLKVNGKQKTIIFDDILAEFK